MQVYIGISKTGGVCILNKDLNCTGYPALTCCCSHHVVQTITQQPHNGVWSELGFTAAQIAVWFIRGKEDGVTTRHLDDVEEEDAETADVSRVELVQLTHQTLLTMGCYSR